MNDGRGGYRFGGGGGFSNPNFGHNENSSNGPRYYNNNRPHFDRGGRRPHYNDYDWQGPHFNNNDRRGPHYNDSEEFNSYRRRRPQNDYYPERNSNSNNVEDEEEKEKIEDEKSFKNKYDSFVDKIDNIFFGHATKDEILNIIRALIKMPSLTIFEAMNFIYREIKIYQALKYYQNSRDKAKSLDGDIFENKYPEEFPTRELNMVIENFKTNKNDKKNLNNSYELYEDENADKRREITKNKDGIYNYLPIKSIRNIKEEDQKLYQDLEIFAKTDNEIYFHPLFYKTLMCNSCENKDQDELINLYCPYSHKIQTDFRIIYDFKDKLICELMNDLSNSNLFSFRDYLFYIQMKIKFNEIDLLSFKVHKCQLDKSCPNDYHICPYYHENKRDNEQKRRPPELFKYCSEICDACYDKRKGKYNVKKCPFGDFCNKIHSKNEYNYHKDNFRKQFECTRNPKGKCPYFKTCYGIHNENYSDDEEEESEEESIDDKKIENEISKDKEYCEITEKIDNSVEVSKNFICRKCNNLKAEVCFLVDCNHFICLNCFKKYEHNLKGSKKEKINDLKCPFCLKEIEKGKLIKYKFSKIK